jgi:hypothetical protein
MNPPYAAATCARRANLVELFVSKEVESTGENRQRLARDERVTRKRSIETLGGWPLGRHGREEQSKPGR